MRRGKDDEIEDEEEVRRVHSCKWSEVMVPVVVLLMAAAVKE